MGELLNQLVAPFIEKGPFSHYRKTWDDGYALYQLIH